MADDIASDLAAWSAQRDEAAFRRLVERHSGLVSAVCRRQLGEGASADEAAQAVFIILARRASTVSPPALGSWLYKVAVGVCRNAGRVAARRAQHEQGAAMHIAESKRAVVTSAAWADLRPHLDEAIAALNTSDREVVIGHFLHGLPQATMAERLGISESAARKRITTALAKLHSWFSRRGLSVSAGVLVAGLASEAQAAEPLLTAACAQAALHPASAVGANALASGTLSVGIAKLTAVALTIGLALAGGAAASVHLLAPGPRAPMTVTLTSPAGETIFTAPADITITAQASSGSERMPRVELHDGARLLISLTAAPYTYVWSGVPAGNYDLTATAYDAGGAGIESATLRVMVMDPPPAPAPSAAPAGNAILSYDFEDGIRPADLTDGDIVPGPPRAGNRFCLGGIEKPLEGTLKKEIIFEKKRVGLFHYAPGMQVSFDCWFTSNRDNHVGVLAWDSTQAEAKVIEIHDVAQGQWTRVTMQLDDFGRDSDRTIGFEPGDMIMNLIIGALGKHEDSLYIDNLEITRP